MVGGPVLAVESSPSAALFLTPQRRRISSATKLALSSSVNRSGGSVVKNSRKTLAMTTPQKHVGGDLAADGDKSATGRKRKTASSSSTSASATKSKTPTTKHKKRARMSIGTPGKAMPMDEERQQDVAQRFVEMEVSEVYKAIRKQTGCLGGNAAGGAIYGEITQSSFQRIVDYMKENCELSASSLFLDVGSGLGKPNFHVAIDPGCEVSYGIELEDLRWQLSLHNLKSVLSLEMNKKKPNRTVFTAGDITHARTLNPFSHIYSFDVGFPPNVMDELALIFNQSTARYFASFHSPRKVIEMYGFDVENIGRIATSMAGSSEGHTCYFYRRCESPESVKKETRVMKRDPTKTEDNNDIDDEEGALLHIDPLFRPGFDILKRGRDGVLAWIVSFFGEEVNTSRTRGQKAKSLQQRKQQERPLESYYRVVGKARVAEPVKSKKDKAVTPPPPSAPKRSSKKLRL